MKGYKCKTVSQGGDDKLNSKKRVRGFETKYTKKNNFLKKGTNIRGVELHLRGRVVAAINENIASP